MQIRYKNLDNKLITAQQADLGTHKKEYLQNGLVKIIEKKFFDKVESVTYYKDLTETNEQIFAKYNEGTTHIRIRVRDYTTRPPYILEFQNDFLKKRHFVQNNISSKWLVDPQGRIGAVESYDNELEPTHPEYRGIGKTFYFGGEEEDLLYGIPYLTTGYIGYGQEFDYAIYDPKTYKDDDQDIEHLGEEQVRELLILYPQSIIEWFLNDEFFPPASY